MPKYTRRDFLGTAAAATAALLAGATRSFAVPRTKIPIGVQLYSVRAVAPADVPGTLAGVKKIGYDAVEFAGYYSYNNDAKGLRKLLDDNGLKCCGTHIGLPALTGDALEKTIEFNKVLGNENLVVASMRARTLADWAMNADTFSEIAEKLKPHKLRVGYHNHTVEFKEVEGQIPEDHFFSKAKPEVFAQLDLGHCARAGADPVAYLKKFAGRVRSVHVKEYNPDKKEALVGDGKIKWNEVFDACENVAGTQWYIVEEESGFYKGLDGIDLCYKALKKLLA